MVAQSSQNPGGGYANVALHESLVLRAAGTGRKDGGSVMLRHLLVGFVGYRFCPEVFHHAGLEVIRDKNAGNTTEIPIRVDMAGDPGFLFYVQKGLCVGVSAVGEHRHKQIGVQPLSCVRVHQGRCLTGLVHLHGLTGLVLQMHGGFGFVHSPRNTY